MTGINSETYIKKRQIFWAMRRGIELRGSAGTRGEKAYAVCLDDNLYLPLDSEASKEYENGAGKELGTGSGPGKMQAVHSSSALTVNVFLYWRKIGDFQTIAKALRIPSDHISSIRFEQKLPIMTKPDRNRFPKDPNIDVLVEYSSGPCRCVGIECKFAEAYSTRSAPTHRGLRRTYLDREELWNEIPTLRGLAESICPEDNIFDHLHPAQLVKHILGLKHACGKNGFRLLYLWYDVPFGKGDKHREEIEKFSRIVEKDSIAFQAITWQEVICKLADGHDPAHGPYAVYLTDRYL